MKNSTSNDIIKIKREATKEELESFKLSKHLLNLLMRIIAYTTGVLDLLGLGWGTKFLTPFPSPNKM